MLTKTPLVSTETQTNIQGFHRHKTHSRVLSLRVLHHGPLLLHRRAWWQKVFKGYEQEQRLLWDTREAELPLTFQKVNGQNYTVEFTSKIQITFTLKLHEHALNFMAMWFWSDVYRLLSDANSPIHSYILGLHCWIPHWHWESMGCLWGSTELFVSLQGSMVVIGWMHKIIPSRTLPRMFSVSGGEWVSRRGQDAGLWVLDWMNCSKE